MEVVVAKSKTKRKTQNKVSSKYRDSMFRDFFNDKIRLLSLCNALLNTDSNDPNEIEINTLNGIFFSQSKNDLSCIFRNHFLVIIEHQSTKNENMPLRILFYASEIFKNIIAGRNAKEKIYSEELIHLPIPEFFVFYNGNEDEEESRILKLSDAVYGNNEFLELKVKLFNLNDGNNQKILSQCSYLQHYCTFVNRVKRNLKFGMDIKVAIDEAVNFCCENNIMKDYLNSKRKEIFDMIDFQWNMDEAKKVWKRNVIEAKKIGRAEGENRLGKLISKLLSDGKHKEIQEAAENESRRQQLYQQYNI